MNQLLQHPSAMAALLAALFILYVMVDKVIVPLLKSRLATSTDNPALDLPAGHVDGYRCQKLRFEKRISTLEAEMASMRQDVTELGVKLENVDAKVGDIGQKTAVIYERVEWMHNNRRKRNSDP